MAENRLTSRFQYADNPVGTSSVYPQQYAENAGPGYPVQDPPWYSTSRPWNALTNVIEQATSRIPEGPSGLPGHVMGGIGSSLTGMLAQTENALGGRPVDPQAVTAGMMNFAAPELMARPQAGVLASAGAGPLRAYHGSPHSFPSVAEIMFRDGRPSMTVPLGQTLDPALVHAIQQGYVTVKEHPLGKFDLSKIGTGEGAQAYGHGLYFAENEGVAKGYRDALAPGNQYTVNGRPFSAMNEAEKSAANWVVRTGRHPDEFAKLSEERALSAASDAKELGLEGWMLAQPHIDAAAAARELAKAGKWKVGSAQNGQMYEVNLHADPAKMLDWDKPLGMHAPEVQSALRDSGILSPTIEHLKNIGRDPNEINGMKGVAIQSNLRFGLNDNAAAASAALRDAGIPGLKYLDQGSRGNGQGTSNYVMFDPKLIEIIRKYGLAGMVGGTAAANGLTGQPE